MIKDSLGNSIEDGKYLITFRLYDSDNSDDPIWFENQNVYVYDGILNVLLGNKKRLRPEMFKNPLWVTLEMNKEESEKQYVSASSYSMYSGMVDLEAFAPSEDVHLSLDPDGRIVIDIDSEPDIPSIYGDDWNFYTGGTNNWLFHTPDQDDINGIPRQDMYIKNAHTDYSGDWSRQTTFHENGDLTVFGNVNVGQSAAQKDLIVSGNLTVQGTSSINNRNIHTGGSNDWIFHTPDDELDGVERQDLYIINSKHLILSVPAKDWAKQTIFYENGNMRVNGDIFVGQQDLQKNLYVYGKITAREIEVTLDEYPDYVFKDDYNLLSLSQVEEHINSHGYLPGMPSEKEVIENGINLNEMHLKLVEKIEELTLHMIRIEKENNVLREKLNSITD